MTRAATKSSRIQDHILGKILDGSLRVGDKIPSQVELADQFDVNKMTANKAVSVLVGKGYLERRPGGAGTYVIRTSTYPKGRILMVGPALRENVFYASMLTGAQQAAYKDGYQFEYLGWPIGRDGHIDVDPQRIIASGAAGVLSFGPERPELPPHLPHICLAHPGPDHPECNYVVSDDFGGGYLAAKHLLEMGHRRIIFAVEDGRYHHRLRCDGFARAIEECSDPQAHLHLYKLAQSMPILQALVHQLKGELSSYTALACNSDGLAIRIIERCATQGIEVPRDLSITGFGANNRLYHQHITSIDQHIVDCCFHAGSVLIELIEKKRTPPVHEILPVDLLEGDSVKRL